MRKKTIKNLFDNIFWYIIYLLPIIFLIFAWFNGDTSCTLNTIFAISLDNPEATFGFGLAMDNPLLMPLYMLFGSGGVLPLFGDAGIFMYLGWFISCWIIHLAVDVLLFIVRWAHSMIDGFLGGKHD